MSNKEKLTIHQTSTMIALLDGVFDGVVTYKDLAKKGDFGIGTFNQLDGEMIAFDGEFYHIADGKAAPIGEDAKTPFAIMTTFYEDISYRVEKEMNREQLETLMNELIPSPNLFYAVRIDGKFKEVKTRTVAMQEKPYPSMVDAAADQPTFTSSDVNGTLAGFYTPEYSSGIGVPGYHLHFIDEYKKKGTCFRCLCSGCYNSNLQKTKLNLNLSETSEFLNANLEDHDVEEEIATTE
ncbi:acetolactate decarboxylase [Priestia megaterium]